MRPRMTVLATVVMALSLSLAGCGHQARTPSGSESEARGPGLTAAEIRKADQVTAWANGYCGAVSELVESFSTMPQIDPSSTKRASESSSALLDVMVKGLDRTIADLKQLDPAPLEGAETLKGNAIDLYTGIRDRAVGVKQQLRAATTPETTQAALSSMRKPLEDLGGVNLLGGFDKVAALREASVRASACMRLTQSSPAPSIDPTPRAGR